MSNKREKIIIVDDIATNLTVGKSTLSDKYDVFTAPSGAKLLLLLNRLTPDLILLDIEMPEMDGYEVIEKLKSSEKTMHIPVIFLTGKIDPEHEVKGLSLGAVDYITKPFSRELLLKRIDLHILFERQRQELLKHNLNLESEVDKKTRTVLDLQNAILRIVAELVESRDNVTGGHIERTQHHLGLLIDFMLERGVYTDEIAKWDIPLLIMSSQLHDVGKISIRDNLLLKPGKLTDEEFEEMKKHTIYGVNIIKRIESSTIDKDFLHHAEIFAGTHHERWDGNGYPNGLAGTSIPLEGRLMAIVDVYDALTNDRPYKKAFEHEMAVEIIREGVGTQFDPVVCEIFVEEHKAFKSMDRGKITNGQDAAHPTMITLANTAGVRSGKEQGHTERIRQYLEIIFDAMRNYNNFSKEISSWDKDTFLLSAQLHDIGNIDVKEILEARKDISTDDIKNHAERLTGSHHEKWDGTGYPLGLKAKDIPLEGRIMAIVDVYDALTTDRPHRKRKTHTEAVALIKNGSGTHFDPDLVELFLDNDKEFGKVSDDY